VYLPIDLKIPRSYIRTNTRGDLCRSVKCEHCSGFTTKMAIGRPTIYRDIGICDTGWLVRSFGLYALIDRPFEDNKLSL